MAINGNWDRRGGDPIGRLGSIGRREFLRASGAGAAALVYGAGPYTEKALAAPRLLDYPFRLGVASGDPQPTGVVLWTRLAPRPHHPDGDGGMAPRRVDVRWEIADDERFRSVVRRGTARAVPELAHSVHVEAEGLTPGRQYFYRFKAGLHTSQIGRTATTPATGKATRSLRFAFASCQMYEHGYFTAYRHMAQEDLDFVVHLGDYIYEYGPREYLVGSGSPRRHDSAAVRTLREYRNRHALYRSDRALRAAHAAFPWLVTWDDHEVENDYYADVSAFSSRSALLSRRAAAYRAYYEHMPLRRLSVPRGPGMRLYRAIRYGDLAAFRMLDTRQYRRHGGNAVQRSFLGDTQERWLVRGLANSRARWDVLAQQVFFATRFKPDASGRLVSWGHWDDYPRSRTRILEATQKTDAQNLVVLTGDVHANWAKDIHRRPLEPESAIVGAEFVGTSITSGGDGSDLHADTQEIRRNNPQVRFFNGQRGYVRCRVDQDRWQTDYRVLPYVSRAGAPISTRASFVVEAGRPGVQRAASGRVSAETIVSSEVEADEVRAQREADRASR